MVFSIINQYLIFPLERGSPPQEIPSGTTTEVIEKMDRLVDTIMPVTNETPTRVINTVTSAGVR